MVHQLRRAQFIKDNACPFSIGSYVHDSEHVISDHSHDFVELVFLVDGQAEHLFEGQCYPIRAGDVFIINPGEIHSYRTKPGQRIEIINCLFLPELISEAMLRELGVSRSMDYFYVYPFLDAGERFHHRLNLAGTKASEVGALLAAMIVEWEQRRPGYTTIIRLQLLQLLIMLSRFYAEVSGKEYKPVEKERTVLIRRINGFLERHFDQKLAIPDLCTFFNISNRQLNRIFKQETGQTVTERIHQIRIERAKQYLMDGHDKVIEIAHRVGYEDPSFFTQLFRRKVGCSPGQYRDLYIESISQTEVIS
ncbi:AraC family transcriptional regulator [Paenibacillus filicis]|uniref:AraC family transcriptional regulator n=1 Tax=Paenibacillus gyeongsangnamensis TaxID=3388067 RepID=A0ABT4QKH2_9BACL|nr:AraC family transcriptional regulator [Paenibacillus filicis]MCZ8517373.1 AraC family transcriptional regulator [Paenibacillus filicis]